MALTQITNHVALAQARLLQQYVDKVKFPALVAAFAGRTQVLENAIWSIFANRSLTTAVGTQLDKLGIVIGLVRASIPGATDDNVYRTWLKTWIGVVISCGTIADYVNFFTLATAPGTKISALNSGVASVRIALGVVVQTQGPNLVALLNTVKSGGIHASMDYLVTLPAFGFDGAGAGMDAGYLGGSV